MNQDSAHPDSCLALWRNARRSAETAGPATLDRAAGCLAVALTDMVASSRTSRHKAAATALSGTPGACTVTGLAERAGVLGAATANAYLMHARLTDDSFRVAAHPGLAVVPVALAAVEHARGRRAQVDGSALLRAIVGGYECACLLAERLLPEVSRRGWRVTSVIAPLAAAATMALVQRMPDDAACTALGLAASAAGGPLGVVSSEGDGWRLQPALAVQSGMTAAIAASAGLRDGAGALTGKHGLYGLFADSIGPPAPPHRPRQAAVHRVTFKRYPTAMFGQSIFDALRRQPPISGGVARIAVRVAPFAAEYGDQGAASTDSISSLPGITMAALRAFHPGLAADADAGSVQIEVIGDPALAELVAHVHLELSDGRRFRLIGDGDTSGWDASEFRLHCVRSVGEVGGLLHDAATALSHERGMVQLLELWRTAR